MENRREPADHDELDLRDQQRVEQIDRRTNEAVRPLPGKPLGGTSHRQG